GNENGGVLVGALSRTNGSLGPVSVIGYTTDGSAVAGADYKGATNTIKWTSSTPFPSSGTTSNQTFTVQIINDTTIEGDETFDLHALAPIGNIVLGGEIVLSGAALGAPDQARANIIEDDTQPSTVSFSTLEYTVNE